MKEFNIEIHSFSDVKDFVAIATVQPFQVMVGNATQSVNGKSFIGMFSLDFHDPLTVSVDCSEAEFLSFRNSAARFWA